MNQFTPLNPKPLLSPISSINSESTTSYNSTNSISGNDNVTNLSLDSVDMISMNSLGFEEAVALMIQIGAPSNYESLLNDKHLNKSNFDGKLISAIDKAEELEEIGLQVNLISKRIFGVLKDYKTNGIPVNLMESIRTKLNEKMEVLIPVEIVDEMKQEEKQSTAEAKRKQASFTRVNS